VHTLDGDWGLALELLASVVPDGRNAVTAMLVEGAGAPSKALELCLVTSNLTPRLVDRLLQRSVTRRGTSVVYVDAPSYANGSPDQISIDARAQVGRLEHAGVAVCVLRQGDDLLTGLGAGLRGERAAVG
jgi:hypothetical protein